jgi:hypothetical protein
MWSILSDTAPIASSFLVRPNRRTVRALPSKHDVFRAVVWLSNLSFQTAFSEKIAKCLTFRSVYL